MHYLKFVVLGLLSICVLLSGCSKTADQTSSSTGRKILVAVSIPPLADFSKRIGGNRVSVRLLVPPGASPHTYQPKSDDLKYLSNADLLVLNGLALEFWSDKVIDAASNSKLKVLDTSAGIPVISESEEHKSGNPHIWLNPEYALIQAESIYRELCKIDPKSKSLYTMNFEKLKSDLNKLDSELAVRISGFKQKSFVTFHPAWIYFANRYGLKQAASIEEFPGKEPSPQKLKEITEIIKATGVKALFAEPQFSPRTAESIANDTGIKVLMLDPLGSQNDWNYEKMIMNAVDQMSKAMEK